VKLAPRPQRPVEPLIAQETTAEEGTDDGAKGTDVRLGILVAPLTPELARAMDLTQDQTGILIQQVEPGSPAADAGLLGGQELFTVQGLEVMIGGDIITAIDNAPITTPQELLGALNDYNPGDEVTIHILRDGKDMSLAVILGEANVN